MTPNIEEPVLAAPQAHRSPGQGLWDRPSVRALIAANVVPAIGVALFGWDVQSILLVYWCESAVIGFYTALKMLKIAGAIAVPMIAFFAVHYGMFMLVHLVFLVALTSGVPLDGSPVELFREAFHPGIWWGVAALLVSHGVSYHTNFLRGREYDIMGLLDRLARAGMRSDPAKTRVWKALLEKMDPTKRGPALRVAGAMSQMFSPYGRIVLMQVTLIAGAFAFVLLGWTQWPVLILLIVGKTVVDLRAHAKEHGLSKRDRQRQAGIMQP